VGSPATVRILGSYIFELYRVAFFRDGGVTRDEGLEVWGTVDDKGSSATSTSSSDKNLRAPRAFDSFNIMPF
jgi:hypothetical protein